MTTQTYRRFIALILVAIVLVILTFYLVFISNQAQQAAEKERASYNAQLRAIDETATARQRTSPTP